jgi:serine/threonine-protein kinase
MGASQKTPRLQRAAPAKPPRLDASGRMMKVASMVGQLSTVELTPDELKMIAGLAGKKTLYRTPTPAVEVKRSANDFSTTDEERTFFEERILEGRNGLRYQSQKKLVAGGMGAILEVRDQDLLRTVVKKVVLPQLKGDRETLRRFVIEARITGLLEHPNIIPVHELGFDEETGLYFTMKLARGETLLEILDKLRREEPAYVARYTSFALLNIFRKICDAVAFAHANSIIHQDIKPMNVIVGEHGEVLLMDWGLAKYVGDPAAEKDPARRLAVEELVRGTKGQRGAVTGTLSYLSPEQCAGRGVDRQSDVFLLGATLYHLFTLEPPYTGKTVAEIFAKAQAGDLIPPEIRTLGRQIPEDVCRIIRKAMARRKSDRYPTVEALIQDVDDLIAGTWRQEQHEHFEPGDFLMKEGEAGEQAYLILTGRVEVLKQANGGPVVLGNLRPGDLVGEMSLIAPGPRSASVRAVEPTEVAVLTRARVEENFKRLPPYVGKIVSALSERLRVANENVHPLAGRDPGAAVLKQLRLLLIEREGPKAKEYRAKLAEVVSEIAQDLSIAEQRVRQAILRAASAGHLRLVGEELRVAQLKQLGAG